MKFEHKYPNAIPSDKFEFEYSYVTKTPKLGTCRCCNSYTKWIDVLFAINVCSEECNSVLWKQYKEDQKQNNTYDNFEEHFKHVKAELQLSVDVEDPWKDIIIVVKDQLDYFKQCIDSIKATTKNYHLYIWDNASQKETSDYIENLMASHNAATDLDWKITFIRSEQNTGFIHPNNELAAMSSSPYIIPLNSDTKVFENWDRNMIGFLKANPDVLQVGYWGGHLGEDGRGFGGGNGYEVDYIPGWCFCISRNTYQQFGLFSNKLQFAYCEDADLSLRIQEQGKKIYSLYTPLVHHYQNKTVVEVEKEGKLDLRATFDNNHKYMKERWKDYLANNRVLVRKKIKGMLNV